METNPLDLAAINVAIVGSGAVGSALAASLAAEAGVRRVYLLCRRPERNDLPTGVLPLHLDAEDEAPGQAAADYIRGQDHPLHLLVNTVGILHDDCGMRPEKRLAAVGREQLLKSFQLNAMLLPALAQAFGPLMRHDEPALLASLSARVGSIEDNRSGGWYSYRASKAAHNMLLRTLAREWRISHSRVIVAALHPGTVQSRLSAPFLSAAYRGRVLQPLESAQALVSVMRGLTPSHSGGFYDWRGEPIPW